MASAKRNDALYRKRKYKDYCDDQLQKAIDEVRKKGSSVRKAAEKFGVTKSTLCRHLNGISTGKVGRPFVFLESNQDIIAECIALAGDWGFSLDRFDIRLIVKSFLDRKGVVEKRFKNNMPGREWVRSFISRYKEKLVFRLCQNQKRSRAGVNSESINSYFDELSITLQGVEPHLIINYDETNITDDPGRKNVIVRRGCRHPERIVDFSKSSTSVMFSAAADGTLLPIYITYKSENLYNTWCEGGPKGTMYNRTKSGWFTLSIFEDWFKRVILPYYDKFKNETKVIIGDNLASHISPWVIEECLKNNIKFVLLPPNSTGICQPLDVAFFKPLKVKWRCVLLEWKTKNRGCISKDRFPRLLNHCLIEMGTEKIVKNIKSGFRGSGIVPLDREQVLKRLPMKKNSELTSTGNADAQLLVNSFEVYLEESRRKETEPLRVKKKKINVQPGKSVDQSMLNTDVEAGPSREALAVKAGPSRATLKKVKVTTRVKKSARMPEVANINEGESSSDESDAAYSVHDSSDELHFSDLSGHEYDEDIESDNDSSVIQDPVDLKPDQLSVGSFAVVKIKYNKGTKKECIKKFIGEVVSVEAKGHITFRFLRRSTKSFNIYVFPTIDDVMTVSYKQVIASIEPLNVSRGRYKFPLETD